MSSKLKKSLESILKMPYFKNDSVHSGETKHAHEYAVAARLDAVGFSECDLKLGQQNRTVLKQWAKTSNDTKLRELLKSMPVGSYIVQPGGSQSYPDILVRDFNDRFVAIECKSNKNGNIMWNDSLPYPNGIYVLSSKKYNETTVFMGADVISLDEFKLREKIDNELQKIIDDYDAQMKKFDTYNRGWLLDFRTRNDQRGGYKYTDYFKHVDRLNCEESVLIYAEE